MPASQSSHSDQSEHQQFAIQGMSCQACATRIEKVLGKQPAIQQASVNFATETLNVDYDGAQLTTADIVDRIAKTGFTAEIVSGDSQSDTATASLPWRTIAIWICLLPFLWGMVGMLSGQGMTWMPPLWVQFALATVVQFGLALPFYQSAWASIKGGVANMDVLVMLGTLTIWAYSTYIWLTHLQLPPLAATDASKLIAAIFSPSNMAHEVDVYFEAGVMVIAFVRLGKYLEERTKKRSLNSLDMLRSLTPTTVEQRQPDGSLQTVELSRLSVGDEVRAKQGSRVATDGVVMAGSGWCNESHLTGESVPVAKQVGDTVLAGALVDNGSLIYSVTALGQRTQLGDMIQALSDAQGSKADLARLADKVTAVFVPVVVGIALLTLIVTGWLTGDVHQAVLHAVSVLVIACPCALGLATPAAIMAGMGVAARHGVWYQDAPSLEAAGQIDTVVVDKTGTLTKGRPTIVDCAVLNQEALPNTGNHTNIEALLQIAASLEVHTSHPLASAIVTAAANHELPLLAATEVDVVQGQGVLAQVADLGEVRVGTPDFASVTVPQDLPEVWQIASQVGVSINGTAIGIMALADDLKPEAKQTIAALHQDDIEVILMSGDKSSVVAHVANQLGIKTALAQLSPRDKAERIKSLQAQGHRVAMVGDGVNDAPAMATADASFAMFEGTDVAKYSASARLMGGSLLHVDAAQKIARATRQNIKQNLFFAFLYNCVGIPLAAFGLLNPMIAAAAMALSSISVLMNALRLNRFHTRIEIAE